MTANLLPGALPLSPETGSQSPDRPALLVPHATPIGARVELPVGPLFCVIIGATR
jgi:hypothetical protein